MPWWMYEIEAWGLFTFIDDQDMQSKILYNQNYGQLKFLANLC